MTQAALQAGQQQLLLALLEAGLPHCDRPYQQLAERIGASERVVVNQVRTWQDEGRFRRFGLVIHHRSIGISANVMLVLDIPDAEVAAVAGQLSREPQVTLCYQRPRRLPDWRYNLFCMVHGRERAQVEAKVTAMLARHGLQSVPQQMLFSLRAFKQRGARYGRASQTSTAQLAGSDA